MYKINHSLKVCFRTESKWTGDQNWALKTTIKTITYRKQDTRHKTNNSELSWTHAEPTNYNKTFSFFTQVKSNRKEVGL